MLQTRRPSSKSTPHHDSIFRLLVVDDEPINRTLLKRLFDAEYAVFEASNGTEALHMIQQHNIDMVLLDVMMPGMSGFEMLEILRHKPETADLPVIMVSARADDQAIVQGLQLGANDYITKPINIDIARARVQAQAEKKRLSDHLKQTIGELKAAQKTRENFLRIVAHDLKGPLTNMRMGFYLLRDMIDYPDDAQEVLENIDTSLASMHDMINVFLDAATVEAGALNPNPVCLPVQDVIRRNLDQYALVAAKKRIRLHVEPDDHELFADPQLLSQIIGNLVNNAIKFAPPETCVTVWTEANRHWTRIHVADQGPGIPIDERGRLFEMFGKLSNRPTGTETSTGLGLWIVKHLTELLGGRVGAECPPDGGSIFWVMLPSCEDTLPAQY